LRTIASQPLEEAQQHGVVQATLNSHLSSACSHLELFVKTQLVGCLMPDSTGLSVGIWQSHPLEE